jgi:hypothetical protein
MLFFSISATISCVNTTALCISSVVDVGWCIKAESTILRKEWDREGKCRFVDEAMERRQRSVNDMIACTTKRCNLLWSVIFVEQKRPRFPVDPARKKV